MQVLVAFKDGRSCVIAGPAKGVSLLLQAGSPQDDMLPTNGLYRRSGLLITLNVAFDFCVPEFSVRRGSLSTGASVSVPEAPMHKNRNLEAR